MLTNRNAKLGKKIYSFSISRESCLHKTAECEKYCYAKRGHYAFKKVQSFYERMLQATKSPKFEQIIIAYVRYLKLKEDIKFIRLHASGDFYDQEYYEKWNNIASKFPEITFLAYTRNYDIDFSGRVDNFVIYYSTDDSTEKYNPTLELRAQVVDKKHKEDRHMTKLEDGSFLCNSKCNKCKFCFLSGKNVSFARR